MAVFFLNSRPGGGIFHGNKFRDGHLFADGRFFYVRPGRAIGRRQALLVEPGHPLAQVCHYIHLNPVRANVMAADKAFDYPWSSLSKFALRARAGVAGAKRRADG